MKTKSVQKCSTSQSFTFPKFTSFKIGTLRENVFKSGGNDYLNLSTVRKLTSLSEEIGENHPAKSRKFLLIIITFSLNISVTDRLSKALLKINLLHEFFEIKTTFDSTAVNEQRVRNAYSEVSVFSWLSST